MVATRHTTWLMLLIVGSLAVVAASDWKLYKSRHGKSYADPKEEAARKEIFLRNKRAIEEHNAGFGSRVSYLAGLNEFADWTRDEINQRSGRTRMSQQQYEELAQNLLSVNDPLGKWLLVDDGEPIPDEVDWRKSGRVSEVKSQGSCLSDYAFAVAGVLEGQQANLNISKLVPLSVQNVLDCSNSNLGCFGGPVHRALADIASEGGIDDEESYPYDGMKLECRFKKEKSVLSNKGYKLLPPDENVIKRVVAKFGPVAATMDRGAFLDRYTSGVYADDPYCSQDPYFTNEGVLIVGYGRDKRRGDYWIIKNTWGKSWGEQGYFRMLMHENMCGIKFKAVIPTF